jgi:glycosyltransferase involved in cell wall biosynthesis
MNAPGDRAPLELPPLEERPLVSVLVPNHNYGAFVGEAIDSVLQQTYPNVEVIVVDDGSTDDSVERIASICRRDPRARLLTQENSGPTTAINRAYAASSGSVICILDADDAFHPDKIRLVVEAFRADPSVGMLSHRLLIQEEGSRAEIFPVSYPLPRGWLAPSLEARGGFVPWVRSSMICLRREVADRVMPLDPDSSWYDAYISTAAALLTRLSAIDEPLGTYRVHGTNDSFLRRWASPEEVVERKRIELAWTARLYESVRRWAEGQGYALPAFERSRSSLEREYVIARLTKAPRAEARRLHRELLAHVDSMSKPLALYYRISPVLPGPMFRLGWLALTGHSLPKRIASRALELARRRPLRAVAHHSSSV